MRKLLITAIFLVNLSSSFSQCISIELAIEWKEVGTEYYDNYNLHCIPYLSITYRNNSCRPFYFLKICNENMSFPPITCGGTLKRVNTISDLKKLNSFSNKKYKVGIGGATLGWEVSDYLENIEVEHETNAINDVLFDLYEIIIRDIAFQKKDTLFRNFNAKDINENGILTKLRDNFVFLKSGEKFIDKYNLIGFQMVGGDYTFMLNNDSLSRIVYTDPLWNKSQEEWVFTASPLPPKVENYSLYSGTYFTNNVSIRFTESQRK